MRIMLFCNAGMSTSILVNKMRESAKIRGLDVEISASSVEKFNDEFIKADVILLGPQIKFQLRNFKPLADKNNIKIGVIDMKDYGMINGAKVLQDALNLLDE